MGLFDTVKLSDPLKIPGFAKLVSEFQTKEFGSAMRVYTIGSLLPESPVHYGIVKEQLWEPSKENENGITQTIYLVIWHHILAGVYLEAQKAEERLRTVDRLDLIRWLDQAQRKAHRSQRRYQKFHHTVSNYHQHLKRSSEEKETPFDFLWRLPEEILNDPDPLGKILEREEQKETENDDDNPYDWFD